MGMKDEGVRSEKLDLLGTEPVSATRGSGELRVGMSPGLGGLLGFVAIDGETSREEGYGCPDNDSVRAVLEVTARWWGGGARGGESAVACRMKSGLWWVALLRSEGPHGDRWLLGEWMLPKYPGAAAGSEKALVGLFGEPARRAISRFSD